MPLVDAIQAQKELCGAIAQLHRDGPPEISRLDALLALDRRAQSVGERLLSQYVEGDAQLRSFEWKAWQAALRLSQSLFQAYEYFLQHVRQTTDAIWTGRADLILVQLFHHRKLEFLLRFLRYKKRTSEQWRQLHEMFRFAQERDLPKRSDAIGETAGGRRAVGQLEQQYLQILLLEVMNCGQFSPREALWAHRWFARWCHGSDLKLVPVEDRIHVQPTGFVVDLCGSDGLKRAATAGGDLRYLDPSPLSVMIDQEIASLRDGAPLLHRAAPAVRAGQLALLDKLAILFAPNPIRIERRAERKPVDLTVQAIAGFPYIVELLRTNGQKPAERISSAAVPGNDITISPFGGNTFSPRFAAGGDAGSISFPVMGPFDAIPQPWQVKDRSDLGCRMRGQIENLNRVIPGSLIVLRDREAAPWVVSVVRWFRRLMVDHVEIGVEYLGRNPRLVKMVANHDGALAIGKFPDSASRCFAALYLPPSEQHPTMPIKTLLLPAGEFRAGCNVTLLSSSATYRMRLNEPIQQQFEFVWTSFAVISKLAPSGF